MRSLWLLTLSVALLSMVGCGGSDKKYYIPVDSPAQPFTPPEADELGGADGADDDWSLDETEEPEGDEDQAEKESEEAAGAGPKNPMLVVLRENRPKFKFCYVKALEKSPNLKGRVEVTIKVDVSGKVVEAAAKGIPGVDGCVAKIARGIQFPPPPGGKPASVSYPLVFEPGS